MSVESSLDLAAGLVAASPTGLPKLAAAVEASRRALASGDRKQVVDAEVFARCVGSTIGNLWSVATVACNTSKWRNLPGDTLVADAPALPRDRLVMLLKAGLRPERKGLSAIVGIFSGPAQLPFVSSIDDIANELVDGLTVGEVLRRKPA